MKRILYFSILAGFTAIAGVSCNQSEQKGASATDQVPTGPGVTGTATAADAEATLLSGDTVSISGRYVLFFGPSEKRQESIKQKNGGNQLITEEASAHAENSRVVIDSLLKAGGPACSFTESRFVRLTMFDGNQMVIDRYKLKEETGLYMTDGHQVPVLRLGKLSSDEMHRAIAKFFFPTQPS